MNLQSSRDAVPWLPWLAMVVLHQCCGFRLLLAEFLLSSNQMSGLSQHLSTWLAGSRTCYDILDQCSGDGNLGSYNT